MSPEAGSADGEERRGYILYYMGPLPPNGPWFGVFDQFFPVVYDCVFDFLDCVSNFGEAIYIYIYIICIYIYIYAAPPPPGA